MSCKTEESLVPKKTDQLISTQQEVPSNIEQQANAIADALVEVLENDTVRNTLYIECGKGMYQYYWVSFEILQASLDSLFDIDLYKRMNRIIARDHTLPPNGIYVQDYISAATVAGFHPHLMIPNLHTLSGVSPDIMGSIALNHASAPAIAHPNVGTWLLSSEPPAGYNFETRQWQNNVKTSKLITPASLCVELMVLVSYRIVNLNTVSPCSNGSKKVINNCIFRDPICRVCEEVFPHNPNVNKIQSSKMKNEEILIRLNNFQINGLQYPTPCHQFYNYISGENASSSFGNLGSMKNLQYYKPIPDYAYPGFTQGRENIKNKIVDLPITAINESTLSIEDVNSLSLCYIENTFHAHGDMPGENELAGGIYVINRLNGLPLYFYFPGHIYGPLMWTAGADHVVHYDLKYQDQFLPKCDVLSPAGDEQFAAIMPQGNLSALNIKVYKIN
jgi:hypothetical protein